jgi:fatty-acyl-CoA synthase
VWPAYAGAADLEAVEQTPLAERDLPESVYAVLRDAASSRPDAPAHLTLRDGARWDAPVTRTFAELLEEVHRVSAVLRASRVGRTDAVGLLSPNTAELVPALLAAESAAIAAPLNPALAEHDLAVLLQRAAATVLVAAGPELEPRVWDTARRLAEQLGLRALLALRPTGSVGPAPALEPVAGTRVAYLADLAATAPADALPDEPASSDVAAYFHTGGTTGTPRLAVHTHRMQVVDAWCVALGMPPAPDAAFFAALPLFHVNALIVTTLAPLMRAQPVVWAGPLGYRDPSLAPAFWRLVERYRVAAMSGVPTVYGLLSSVPVDADISSLRLAIVGAAPLPPAVAQRWHAHTGVPLCEGYGLTEATCASARSFPDDTRPGHVGQRLPYHEVVAMGLDEQTGLPTPLPAGEVGSIAIRGEAVFPGYVVGRDASGPVLDADGRVHDGWLDTGDLGSVSADGWIRLVGRAKDVIIRGGHNIDPLPVEQVLLDHPAVADAGVVGRPDPRVGEVPVAFVVLRDATADVDEIRLWAAARVPEPAAAPSRVSALPGLPVTAVGKPDKVALRVLATRAELADRLVAAGAVLDPGGAWCVARDGVVRVEVESPDKETAESCRAVLERYTLDSRVTVVPSG